jgi:uncharacterized protein
LPSLSTLHARYGDWAVVTGASTGIGREIAKQLASAGFHLALAARSEAALNSLASQIQSEFAVEAIAIPTDLSLPNGTSPITQAMAQRKTGLLVNSAGFGTGGDFLDADLEQQEQMIDLNCRAVVTLCHHFGRRFAQQQRGGIVLLSSIVAFQGVARSANYAATKAYIQSFGEALREELAPSQVDVLCAAPGPTNSGFANRAGMKFDRNAASSEQVARAILEALAKRRAQVVPGGFAKFLYASLMTAPRFARVKIMKGVMKSMT